MWNKRSTEPEIIDLGPEHYTIEEYNDCLVKLGQIGRWLGGDMATISTFKKMERPPKSILDVGCGGGIFATKLAQLYPEAKIVGIDLNPLAIKFANDRLSLMKDRPKNVSFEVSKQAELNEPEKSYDVVLSTLVCHHLNDNAIVDFFSRACKVAKDRVIINDLQRSRVAYSLFAMSSPLLFRNRLIQHDGLLSIQKAFTRSELEAYLFKIGKTPSQYKIS